MVDIAPLSFQRHQQRVLGSNDEDFQSYLVDADGNDYDSYSLAWRYLGMYIDCDIGQGEEEEEAEAEEEEVEDRKKRNLESGDGDGDGCSRKLLWAAYHDPRYRGGSIGEYQYFNWVDGTWDKSTCQTRRCARMNCHERRTHFKLVGVFKETDGLYDWAEQLFKHQGYCLWDGDKEDGDGDGGGDGSNDGDEDSTDYGFMQTRLEKWVTSCTEMQLTDDDGNAVYLDTKPCPNGNMTYGMYYDEDCTEPAEMTFGDYVIKYYETYYYSQEEGIEAAENWEGYFDSWNYLMNTYKVCQPCRAYNRIVTIDDDESDERRRQLAEENDGEGDEEQWGYNCYDDAGYRNCNQCYKFETKTDLEVASVEDLKRASAQGTILAIKVDGVVYGSGGFQTPPNMAAIYGTLAGFLLLLLGGLFFALKRTSLGTKIMETDLRIVDCCKSRRQRQAALPPSLREGLFSVETKDAKKRKEKKEEMLKEQQDELEQLQVVLNQERMLRQLERSRANEYITKLEQQVTRESLTRIPDDAPLAASDEAAVNDTADQTEGELC